MAAGQRGGGDLGARVLVAIPAIAVALFLVIEGGLIFTLGLIVLGGVCMHELFTMYERAHPARIAGFLGLVALLLAADYGTQRQVLLALVVVVPIAFFETLAQPRPSVGAIALALLATCWIGLGFAFAVMLRGLPHGEGVVIDALVGTFLGDTGAYLGGRMFGRRPLAPTVSPNKTVEGLVIGMFAAILAVFLAGLYQTWLSQGHAILLGVAVAVVAPLGDLFESVIKRDAGAKDSGSVFGPHGGARPPRQRAVRGRGRLLHLARRPLNPRP